VFQTGGQTPVSATVLSQFQPVINTEFYISNHDVGGWEIWEYYLGINAVEVNHILCAQHLRLMSSVVCT
jgi:hypothetical protein